MIAHPRSLDELSPEERRALLKRLLRKQGGPTMTFPLSFAQQRLWFLDQLAPGNPGYNIPVAVRLRGRLDLIALNRAISGIIRRHQALRTTFTQIDGQPMQMIARHRPVRLPLLDLQGLPQAERMVAALQIAEARALLSFDLAQGPLLQIVVLRLGADEHILMLTMHHIIADAWSSSVFMRELAALYEGYVRGQPAALARLPLQYADFAIWQRGWLQGEVLETHLAYWRQHFATPPPALDLPADYPRPPAQTFRGAHHMFSFDPVLSTELVRLSQNEHVTLFMLLLAVWQVLLYHYSGQEDFVVGTPIANRNRTDIEGLIGYFVNTLALRTDLSGNPPFREVLRRVRAICLGAYAHQDLPFEMLVEALKVPRDLRLTPLFQAMFVLQNAPMAPLKLTDLTLEGITIESGTAKFDMTLTVFEAEDALMGLLEYSTDLFAAATVERIPGHLAVLLQAIVADPEQPIGALPLLTTVERQQVLETWTRTTSPAPPESCVHELFALQAASTADAIVAVYADQYLSYGELERRANQLAHYLRQFGVGPEVPVGLYLARSLDLVIALLGILKAGGAYLPLDPAAPAERLAFMLADALAPVLITQSELIDNLPATWAAVVCLGSEWTTIGQQPTEAPHVPLDTEYLAYIIYTSGSTGTPKGASISHRSVVRLVAYPTYVHLDADTVMLQLAPIAFDASTFEVWGCLIHGGRLVLAPALLPALADLGALIVRERVTTLWLTAGLFQQMVESELAQLRGVRQLLAGGDVLSVAHVQRVLNQMTGCRMINGYGPTENTTFTCCYTVPTEDTLGASVPIGRPIGQTQVYVLDEHTQPVPIGVAGELYIGGMGLARGYLHRPALTAERFVPHPFSDQPGARLYRSGDRTHWRADGTIEFLGRIDHQIKLRGYRVELEEVEIVLARHPAVRTCVILAREDTPGDQRLVAYVVSHQSSVISRQSDSDPILTTDNRQLITELRDFLRAKLPAYMVPSAFVTLDAFPLTRNGKIDRGALPAPEQVRPDATPLVAPRTPTEELLIQIWSEVLGVPQIGIHDNFFDLGGHSLLATQLVSRVRDAMQIDLPLPTLFEATTIASLADRIETIHWAVQGTLAAPEADTEEEELEGEL